MMMEPWKELDAVREELLQLQPAIRGEVSPAAHVLGVLELGEGSVVLPGTVIEGHVRIGRGCRIGPNAYLRGETSIGDNCVIGNAVELKSSLLGNQVFVSHLSYIGDSVLCDDVNVGGGCISAISGMMPVKSACPGRAISAPPAAINWAAWWGNTAVLVASA